MQNNTNTRRFHISDVLSVSTGRLVSNRHIDGVYDLEGFLIGDTGISTIGIAMVAQDCKAFLLETFPELRDVSTDRLDELLGDHPTNESARAACDAWVAEIIASTGKEFFDVPAMPTPQPRSVEDDIRDVLDMNPNAKIMPVILPDNG